MKTFLAILFALALPCFADEPITKLDSGRFVYFDGNLWVYVWLTKDDTEVNYIVKSIYRPEHMGQQMTKESKTIIGTVEIGAKVK